MARNQAVQFEVDRGTLKAEEFLALIQDVGWDPGGGISAQGLDAALQSSTAIYTARLKGGRLVGLARVLSDHYLFSTIPEILIHPDSQNMGMGRELLELIKRDFGHTVIFFGVQRGNEPFFEKLGFKPSLQSYEGGSSPARR